MLKFCLGYNETKLLCDKITMRQNSSKVFTSKAKKLRCKKFHNHQECRDESEIYNYHRAQLSNNKFVNGIFGFTLHDLAWLQSLSFYDTGFTKTFSFISSEHLSFYTALTVTSILLDPATKAITPPSTGGYREKHKKR